MMSIELHHADSPTSQAQRNSMSTSDADAAKDAVVPLTSGRFNEDALPSNPAAKRGVHERCLRSGCRIFLIFFLCYVALIALFALLLLTPGEGCIQFAGKNTDTFSHSVWLSHHSFSTIGYGHVVPTCNSTQFIVMLESFTSLAFSAAFGGYVFIFVRKWKVSQTCPCCIVGTYRKELVGDTETGEGIGRRTSGGSGGGGGGGGGSVGGGGGGGSSGNGSPRSSPVRRQWSLMGGLEEEGIGLGGEAGDEEGGDGAEDEDEEAGGHALPPPPPVGSAQSQWMDSLMKLKQLKDLDLLTESQYDIEKATLMAQRGHGPE